MQLHSNSATTGARAFASVVVHDVQFVPEKFPGALALWSVNRITNFSKQRRRLIPRLRIQLYLEPPV
jgi:hypothetical protein